MDRNEKYMKKQKTVKVEDIKFRDDPVVCRHIETLQLEFESPSLYPRINTDPMLPKMGERVSLSQDDYRKILKHLSREREVIRNNDYSSCFRGDFDKAWAHQKEKMKSINQLMNKVREERDEKRGSV